MLIEPVLSKNTNELKISPKMAPNCLFFPVLCQNSAFLK